MARSRTLSPWTLWWWQSEGFQPQFIDQETKALRAHAGSRDRPLGLGGQVEPFSDGGAPLGSAPPLWSSGL